MPVQKVACPQCRRILKSPQPLPIGKMVKCSRCGVSFPVTEKGMARAKTEAQPPGPPSDARVLTAGIDMVRLGVVLIGVFVYLGAGAALALYCFRPLQKPEPALVNSEPITKPVDREEA